MRPIKTAVSYEFSQQELVIIRMVAEGYRNRAIAAHLNRDTMTVKNVLTLIYAALDLPPSRNNRVLLARIAQDAGLCDRLDDGREALIGFMPKEVNALTPNS